MTFRPSLLLACLALLFASGLAGCGRKGPLELPPGGLAGCGRKGPLELPPETQAYGEALKKQKQEAQGSGKADPTPPFDPNSEKQPKKSDIPGTSGNRPPQEYPFPLDPIL